MPQVSDQDYFYVIAGKCDFLRTVYLCDYSFYRNFVRSCQPVFEEISYGSDSSALLSSLYDALKDVAYCLESIEGVVSLSTEIYKALNYALSKEPDENQVRSHNFLTQGKFDVKFVLDSLKDIERNLNKNYEKTFETARCCQNMFERLSDGACVKDYSDELASIESRFKSFLKRMIYIQGYFLFYKEKIQVVKDSILDSRIEKELIQFNLDSIHKKE